MPTTLIFKKTVRQKKAIKLIASGAKNVMLFGGSRSGKSFIVIYALFVRACKEKSRHVCLRFKFNHIKTSLWMDTAVKVHQLCFPDCGATYNKTDYFIGFPNGSEIWFSGLDNSERVEKILGKEYSTIFFNECSQLSYEAINIAKTRLAELNGLRKVLIYDQNPPSKRHWTYWLWEKLFDPQSEKPVSKDDYVSITMNPDDNLQNIDKDYLEMLSQLPEKERKRFLDGLYIDSDDGIAYYEFDRELHVQEIPMDKMKELAFNKVCVGMDFNVDPMTAVVGYYDRGTFYVIDEVFQNNSDTPRMCDELISKEYYGADIFPDSTGKRRQTGGKTDFKELADRGFNNEGVRNPYQVDRVSNINRLFKNNKIIIDPRCKKLIKDLEMVSWKKNELDKTTDSMLTHISDAFGYWAWALDNIVFNKRKTKTYQL